MKRIVKILFAVLILLIVLAGVVTFMHLEPKEDVEILDNYTTILAKNSNGTVYKIECGNNSSDDTAIVILGVHSLESGIHNATNETLIKFSEANNLSKRYIVYFIKLNFNDSGMNISDYSTNRHMGEMLAHEYVLPDIEKYDPFVIVDVHEMEDYWEKQRYVGVIDNTSDLEMEYAYRINGTLGYPVYTINGGTSPEWVTIPLEKKDNNVILFETAQADSQKQKKKTAVKLVGAIDDLPVYD